MNFNVLPPAIDGGNTDDCPENLGNPYITQLIRPLLNRHQRQVADLSHRIEELEMKIADQKQAITSQAARCHQLDEENRQLREQIFHLKAIQPTLLSVKSSGLEKADATTTRTLNSPLEDIGLPSDIAEKLSARSITKVFDLIRLPESQLSGIDGITPNDRDTIVTSLRLVGLRPGHPLGRSPARILHQRLQLKTNRYEEVIILHPYNTPANAGKCQSRRN